jgi:hypothetical protein
MLVISMKNFKKEKDEVFIKKWGVKIEKKNEI